MRELGLSRNALAGVGSAGLACGVVLAIVLGTGQTPRAEGLMAPLAGEDRGSVAAEEAELLAPKLPPDKVRAAAERLASERLLELLEEAHALARAERAPLDVPALLRAALAEATGDADERRELLGEAYAATGVGRLVRAGRLTAVGEAVVTRLRGLERHGIDPAPYGRGSLEEAIVELLPGVDDGQQSAVERVVLGVLEGADFDREAALRKLEGLASLPDPAEVQAIVAELKEREVGRSLRAEDVALDVRLAAAVVQLGLDFKLVRRAGPTELRSTRTAFARAPLRRQLLGIVTGILDAPDGPAAMALLDPPHPQYQAMLDIHDTYRGYAAAGGCKELPTTWRIRPGARGDEVRRLQERLACEGYYTGPIDGVYEGASLAAGRTYQRHHELVAEGNIFEQTLRSMNVSMERRVEQIALALQRMRESDIGEMGDFFIRINLPTFELAVYEGGEVIRRHRTIIGTNRLDDDKRGLVQGHLNRTKLFTTNLYEIQVNPTWILPARIEHGLLKGAIARDPDYLEKNNIRRVTLASGRQVYIQGFGPGNVLGAVKFLLEESNAIYLHDTDRPELFNEARRDYSHGCIRVQHAEEFARWLLARDGWADAEVDQAFRLTRYQRGFKLRAPIDLITEYMTVDISDEGLPVFLTDVYWYDRAYFQGNLPVVDRVRWGAPELRPRWVPRVSERTVNAWRAAGKHAPREYDPAVHGE